MITIGYWALVGLAFGAGVGVGCAFTMILALFVCSLLYSTFHEMYFDG